MAELIGSAFAAGRKVIEMVENANECAEEAKEVAERARYTLKVLESALPEFDGNEHLSKRLLDLRHLFEHIEDTLQRCLPQHTSSSLTRTARRYVFSAANRKTLSGYSEKLTRIAQDMMGPMLLVSRQQGDRIEDAVLALKVEKSEDKSPDPLLKLAKRQLRGKVIYEELVELETSLGSGSFGVVMAGTYYGRPVAIKRAVGILHDPADRESFRREASTHFALRHDRIVQVIAFSIGDDGRPPCLIMERMLGGTLNHYLGTFRDDEQMSLASALPFVIDICEGLKYLHQCGVVHRDIKSLNILLDEQGAKVADFGLARVCSTIGRTTGKNQSNNLTGTYFWMAPEVHNLESSSFDSDIFSLGVVMWEIIETRPGGTGPALGSRLLVDPNAKLPMGGGDGSDPARTRLQSLVQSCCTLGRRERPAIGAILAETKKIYDELPASVIVSTVISDAFWKLNIFWPIPTWNAEIMEENSLTTGTNLSRSEARRRTHEIGSSETEGSSWERWKEIGRSIFITEEKVHRVRETQAAAATAGIELSIGAETLRISNKHMTYGGYGARTGIMIYNATGSTMRFRHNYDIHGHVEGSFPATIRNGHWGLALHVKTAWAPYGSEGFVVYRAYNGDGQGCDVNMCFMTPFRGDKRVYAEARKKGQWDRGKRIPVMTELLNWSGGSCFDLSHQGLAVLGVVAHDSPQPCQFFVGLQGCDIPAPWA